MQNRFLGGLIEGGMCKIKTRGAFRGPNYFFPEFTNFGLIL